MSDLIWLSSLTFLLGMVFGGVIFMLAFSVRLKQAAGGFRRMEWMGELYRVYHDKEQR